MKNQLFVLRTSIVLLSTLLLLSGGAQAEDVNSFVPERHLISASDPVAPFGAALENHAGKSGVAVLEKGEEALLARAWLADWARQTIDVQYFIWSTDNIGILAAEALLRAAERGVRIRVLVDDLLMDAAPESLVALAAHPNVFVRIYNPVHKTGVSPVRRVYNLLTDLRLANQRMHDKTFMVDGLVGITGGRNMADEYFDYDHEFNFRDRDALVMGPVVGQMEKSFEAFWNSPLAKPVGELLKFRKKLTKEEDIRKIRKELHAYARNPENFAPEVRKALADLPEKFPLLLDSAVWTEADFLHDVPGKNDGTDGLRGGGETTRRLANLVAQARSRVTIQTPYLVLPPGGLELFEQLVERGVEVRISTNSLSSTDNLAAFSGYRKQRRRLLDAGIKIYEFKPHPAIQKELMERYAAFVETPPNFSIHAKTLVIDGKALFVGTFNLDPRSAHLNTEVGILISDPDLASEVEKGILRDMEAGNSWSAATDDPDAHSSLFKRLRLKVWSILPLEPLL